MVLVAPVDRGGFTVAPDPRCAALARRLQTARRTDALPRAVGLARRASPPHVVDATAGLGRDALVLARLGCRVTALERVPALAFLLAQAVDGGGFADRIEVLRVDAVAWLEALDPATAPDVVYLDPMFEATGSAEVQKEMQACRALAGPAEDPLPLLRAALAAAAERVVVKRHRAHPPLAPGVAFAVRGERVRFDVYLTGAAPAPGEPGPDRRQPR